MSRHDTDLQWGRGLGLARGRRLLQSGHRPCKRHRPARRWANGEQLSVPNPRVPPSGHAHGVLYRLIRGVVNAYLADRSLDFTCTCAARNSVSSSERTLLSYRYVLERFLG